MKFAVVLLVLAASVLSSEAIVFGQPWMEAPFFARIQYLTAQQAGGQAGGSIISHRHILTSAFVLTPNFVTVNVWVGGATRQTQRSVFVLNRITHPAYQANPRLNDIGIINLNADLPFDRFVAPIALPRLLQFLPYENEQGTALGMGGFPGQTNSDLMAGFLRVTTPARCTQRHPAHAVAQQFCGEDTRMRSDICSDDVGGPLVTLTRGDEVLIGIATTHICHTNVAMPSEPSLFTRVSFFREWILQQTQV